MTGKRNFRQRIVHAGVWTIGGHASSQVLRLLSNLLMTRLLMPEAFGIMAIAHTFMMGLALFSDVGLGQSVVRSKRGEDHAFVNTVWTMQILRGVVLALLCLCIAYGIQAASQNDLLALGSVYAHPDLPWILATLSLSAFMAGFESTNMASATRSLNVRLVTLVELSCQFGALVVMLIWAYWSPSIWVLAFGAVSGSTIRTILTHTFIPGSKNRIHWDQGSVREVFGYGKWIFLSSILGFTVSNGDKLILGGLISASDLGMFSLASFLISAIQQIFSKLGSSVAFPTFCEVLRERPQDLKSTYYKLRLPIDITSLLATGFLFCAGHLVADTLYDQRYKDVGTLLEILSISLLEIRYGIAGQCFMALGHPKTITLLIGMRLPLVILGLPIAYAAYGLQGAAWIAGGNVLCTIPVVIYLKHQFNIFDIKKELQTLPLLIVGYSMGLISISLYKLI